MVYICQKYNLDQNIFDKTSNCKNLKEVKSLKPFIKRELKTNINKCVKIKSKVLMKIVKCSCIKKTQIKFGKRILFL